MLTNTLESHFKTMIISMPLKQQKRLSKCKKNSKEFIDLSQYFKSLFQQEKLSLANIAEYKERYKIVNDFISFSLKNLAKECAKLFCDYLKEVILPDKNQGLFIGSVYLAGTQYAPNITEIYKELHIGDSVKIVRERENPHDSKAVKVLTLKDEKLGYIPARHNLFLSQMLDFDGIVNAQIRKLKWDESGVTIKIMIYADVVKSNTN